jgi:PilZ domain
MNSPQKKRGLLTGGLWNILRHAPAFLRATLLRNYIKISNTLPIELVFKKAETEPETQQALKLIHDTYLEMGHFNQPESRLHFSKFLALPTTVILIAKWRDEVIASVALIADSAFGLPSEPTWSKNNLRNKGERLVEITNLCTKKEASFTVSGSTLFAFCKMVFKYCTEMTKVDLLVTAARPNTKAFYTDILLFESVKTKEGSSFFGFFSFNKKNQAKFEKIYSQKQLSQNLYHYFTKTQSTNIQLTKNRNFLAPNWNSKKLFRRTRPRIDFNTTAVAFMNGSTKAESCKIISISENGVQIKLDQNHCQNLVGKPILITFEYEKEWITCQASIKWFESQKRLGCKVCDKSHSWKKFVDLAWNDLNSDSIKMAS